MTTYFIKHPVIALVLNAFILLLGILSLRLLPVREYPPLSFPSLVISANYPNASAELVETSLTTVLEDRLAGVPSLENISSSSKPSSCTIEMTFRQGTNLDQAIMDVREAIGLARNRLPEKVKEPLVERKSKTEGFPFIVVALESTAMDFGALTHFANLYLRNSFRSLKGVASCDVWGQPYTYQILLDSKKLYAFGVNADEVYEALQRSHISLPVGKFQNHTPTTLKAELHTIEDYQNVLIKEKKFDDKKKKQHAVFLKDVADIQLKTEDEQFRVRLNGQPGLCLAINRMNDANPLEVSTLVGQQVAHLQHSLPPHLKLSILSDQADFMRASLWTIQSSIIEAMICVIGIVFFFLRKLRATFIPFITIPISLIGSLLFLSLCGFSLNIITLLAMVLAVGLVVDDAIVVLENISRHVESGLSAFNAAVKGAKEIGFAIVAMTLTLTSVYLPIAFIPGLVGQLFVEFSVALAGSVLISGIVALTLSPLMCAWLLSSQTHAMWPQIDTFLARLMDAYGHAVEILLKYRSKVVLSILTAFGLCMVFFLGLPHETAPREDRSQVGVWIPPLLGKDINDLEQRVIAIEETIKTTPEAKGYLSFMGNWGASVILPLTDRPSRSRSAAEIVDHFRKVTVSFPSIDVWPWSWDSGLPGLDSVSTGSQLAVIISTPDPYRNLFNYLEVAKKTIDQHPFFTTTQHDLKLDDINYQIQLNTNLMAKLNLQEKQIAKMIEVFFSGDQSLEFTKEGIIYPITLKGKTKPWHLSELYVTNTSGKKISLASVASMTLSSQSQELKHFNQMRAATYRCDLEKGTKLEAAMPILMNELSAFLPSSYQKTWIEAAKVYQESSNTLALLFSLALLFIFAILAIQFENFTDPFIVLITVPLACCGALAVLWITGQSLNIFTQIGLITLIGLISKHGILIVEFVNQQVHQQQPLKAAVIQAAKLRLRPILMTTGAMVCGIIPLILSTEAGFEARRAIGIVLIGGLGMGTVFTLFLLPPVCYLIKSWQQRESETPSN